MTTRSEHSPSWCTNPEASVTEEVTAEIIGSNQQVTQLEETVKDLQRQLAEQQRQLAEQGVALAAFEKMAEGLESLRASALASLSARVGALEAGAPGGGEPVAASGGELACAARVEDIEMDIEIGQGSPAAHPDRISLELPKSTVEPDDPKPEEEEEDGSPVSYEFIKDDKQKSNYHLSDEHHVLEFQPSVWDATVILNMGAIDPWMSVLLVLSLVMSAVFQVFFIMAVFDLREDDYNGELVGDIRLWRVKYGHDVDFASADTDRSLASIVCEEVHRVAEIAGGRQADYFDEIARYSEKNGATLSMLAVLLWFFECSKEFIDLFFFQYGISHAAYEQKQKRAKDSEPKPELRAKYWPGTWKVKTFVVKDITYLRALCLGLFVTLPRFAILLTIGGYGTSYLMTIQELEDIILNSVALGIVLQVDELVFAALAPDVVQFTVARLEPLETNKNWTIRRSFPLLRWALTLGGFFWAYRMWLVPTQDIMTQVQHEMCHGAQNFVTRQDVSKQYNLWVGNATPKADAVQIAGELGDEFGLYRHQATFQATVLECMRLNHLNGSDSCLDSRVSMPHSASKETLSLVEAWQDDITVPAEEQLYAKPPDDQTVRVGVWRASALVGVLDTAKEAYCFDFHTHPWITVAKRNSIRLAVQEQLRHLKIEVNTCADVQHLCKKAAHWSSSLSEGNLVRMACPVTCGCGDPTKGLFHAHELYGCPSVCRFSYDAVLADIPCEDRPDNDKALVEYQTSYEELFYYDAIIAKHNKDGFKIPKSCSSWEKEEGWNRKKLRWSNWSIGPISACDSSTADTFWEYGVRSVRTLCPVTCGCIENPDGAECPGTCASKRDTNGRLLLAP